MAGRFLPPVVSRLDRVVSFLRPSAAVHAEPFGVERTRAHSPNTTWLIHERLADIDETFARHQLNGMLSGTSSRGTPHVTPPFPDDNAAGDDR
jgi:hypothetical protein